MMRRFLSYLRIVFSAFCGLACVLLIVLWVRSYWQVDVARYPVGAQNAIEVGSVPGMVAICCYWSSRFPWQPFSVSLPAEEWRTTGIEHPSALLGGITRISGHATTTWVPYWFLLILFIAVGILPWMRWQFSLRTLLIATTLVALVLGVIAYFSA